MAEDDFEPKRGRPPTGESPKINERIPRELMARIIAFAEEEFMTRGEAIRELLMRGLNGDRK